MIGFDQLHNAWDKLPESVSYFYQIGPFTVQISSHQPRLITQLTRAFAHLSSNHRCADLTIRLWSGPQLPPLDWNLIQTNGYRGYSEHPFYFHYFETIGALSAVDIEKGIAYYAIRDAQRLPWWVSGSPLQVIFHVWFREKGIQMTHGACVCNGKKGILLAGKGGSGKSTTVLACLENGLATLGEDYVLVAPDRTYSIYQTAKWRPSTRAFFPSYESHITNPETADGEKALVHYLDLFPMQILPSSPLFSVVSLKIGTSTYLEKSTVKTSLQSLLLTTVMQLPHPHPHTSQILSERMASLDHYQLTLGPDFKENVFCLKELLQ